MLQDEKIKEYSRLHSRLYFPLKFALVMSVLMYILCYMEIAGIAFFIINIPQLIIFDTVCECSHELKVIIFLISDFMFWFFVAYILGPNLNKARWTIFIIGMIGFLLFGIFAEAASGEREKACRIACGHNLRATWIALKQYADDNEGYFPVEDDMRGLNLLAELEYVEETRIFECPSRSRHPELDDEFYYHYRGGLKYSPDKPEPLLWDRYENHDKFENRTNPLFYRDNVISVLFTDGHIDFYRGDRLKEFYEKSVKQ